MVAGMGGREGGGSPVYHEAAARPAERPEAQGPWRGRPGVRRPGKISETEEWGEGRAAKAREGDQGTGPWMRLGDGSGLDRYAGSDHRGSPCRFRLWVTLLRSEEPLKLSERGINFVWKTSLEAAERRSWGGGGGDGGRQTAQERREVLGIGPGPGLT